jgi:putative peptidoglycan lipid II flippase
MPAIIFLSISGLYTGYLQSYGNFIQPAMTSIVANILLIIIIVIFGSYGIIAAIIAFLLSAVVQVLVQRPFMGKYKYEFYINFKDENVKKMLILSVPIIISTAVGQVNVIVDSTFASHLVAGSISALDNASKISTLINQVFIVSLTTVLYPMLTEKFSLKDEIGFEELLERSINLVIIVAIPLIFGLAVLSTPIVRLLLQHGAFNSADTDITSLCLKYLAFSALGYSLLDILGKVFFSVKDTITPMLNGFFMIALNIILIFVLVPRLGIVGLALATTTSACVIPLIMIVELKYKIKLFKFRKIATIFVKSLFSGVIMSIIVFILYKYTDIIIKSDSIIFLTLKLLIVILIGIIIYIGLLLLLKVKEVGSLVSLKSKK